jgi:hypothetical protein
MKRIVITRRRVLPALAVVLALSLGMTFGMTSSYFTFKVGPVQNSVKMGLVNIGVIEGSSSSPNETAGSQITINSSNNTAGKKVFIRNIQTDSDSAPVYVRVRLIPIWRYGDTSADSGFTTGTGNAVSGASTGDVTYNFVAGYENNWSVQTGIDGETYYYYRYSLQPGETSAQLLNSVIVTGGIPAGKHLEVQVLADAIQAEGGAASQINGWVDPTTLSKP